MAPVNRPNYAPDRRPGEWLPEDLDGGARGIVAFHLAAADVETVAALIEAGAAALKYGPGISEGLVGMGARRRVVRLGVQVARALRSEHARRTTKPPTKRKAAR